MCHEGEEVLLLNELQPQLPAVCKSKLHYTLYDIYMLAGASVRAEVKNVGASTG